MKKLLPSALKLMLALVLLFGVSAFALAQEDVVVTSPPDGATLSGLVVVEGTANFADFEKYDVFLKSGDVMSWAATGYAPVVDGNLLRLDTRRYPNGTYQLVIRKVRSDSNYDEYLGPTYTLDNGENYRGAPYFQTVEPSFIYPPEGRALLRVQNCAGEDFMMDLSSPNPSASPQDIMVSGRVDDYLCTFEDVVVNPAQYQGNGQGLAQTEAIPYGFTAEPGKAYLITYNGPNLGNNSLLIREVAADDPNATIETSGEVRGGSTGEAAPAGGGDNPTPAPTNTPVVAATNTPAAAATATVTAMAAAETTPMLPVSGNDPQAGNPLGFLVFGLLMASALVGAGFIALRRSQHPAE